jgi:hypothetical protein
MGTLLKMQLSATSAQRAVFETAIKWLKVQLEKLGPECQLCTIRPVEKRALSNAYEYQLCAPLKHSNVTTGTQEFFVP